MADYVKLKEYITNNTNTNGSSSSSNAFNNVKSSVTSWFSKISGAKDGSASVTSNGSRSYADEQTTDSWFREADNDPYCPRLVNYLIRIKFFSIY
jgi:hypothetical protein